MQSSMYSAEEFIELGNGIVTICGSTRYFFEAMEANRTLTFNNWIVLQCGSWGHSFHKYTQPIDKNFVEVKRLHFKKILMSNLVVYIANKQEGVTGDSTKAEVQFARERNLPIFKFDGVKFHGATYTKPESHLPDESLIDQFAEIHGGLGY